MNKLNKEHATLVRTLAAYRADPMRMVWEQFGATPDPWQARVLKAFPHSQRLAMKACKGPGKSTILSWLILNFLLTRPRCKIAATSITKENLRDNLWSEIALWRSKSPLFCHLTEWTKERVFMREDPANWFATARAWSRDADEDQQANTLAGLHADYLLFILDEAGGIPDAVAAAAEGGLATGIETKLAIAGNPTHLTGPLYRACNEDRAQWWVIEISGDPDDPRRAPRVSKKWAREMIQKYGVDHPWVRSGVLGKFPKFTEDALVTPTDFQVALEKGARHRLRPTDEPRILGLDVARYGTNLTVACLRIGEHCPGFEAWAKQDTLFTARRAMELGTLWNVQEYRVDVIGVGGGVVDIMDQEFRLPIFPIDSGSQAYESDRFANLRAEMNFALRTSYREQRISLDPTVRHYTTLQKEGTTLKYQYSGLGARLKIESKEEYRRRMGGASPDYWDAHVMAFGDPHTVEGGVA